MFKYILSITGITLFVAVGYVGLHYFDVDTQEEESCFVEEHHSITEERLREEQYQNDVRLIGSILCKGSQFEFKRMNVRYLEYAIVKGTGEFEVQYSRCQIASQKIITHDDTTIIGDNILQFFKDNIQKIGHVDAYVIPEEEYIHIVGHLNKTSKILFDYYIDFNIVGMI